MQNSKNPKSSDCSRGSCKTEKYQFFGFSLHWRCFSFNLFIKTVSIYNTRQNQSLNFIFQLVNVAIQALKEKTSKNVIFQVGKVSYSQYSELLNFFSFIVDALKFWAYAQSPKRLRKTKAWPPPTPSFDFKMVALESSKLQIPNKS